MMLAHSLSLRLSWQSPCTLLALGALACGARSNLEVEPPYEVILVAAGGAGSGLGGSSHSGGAANGGMGIGGANRAGAAGSGGKSVAGTGGVGGAGTGGSSVGGSTTAGAAGAACAGPCDAGFVCELDHCVCAPPGHICSGVCVDATSVEHCGASCGSCPAPEHSENVACVAMNCTFDCSVGFEKCGDACVDLTTDASHCGGCARDCLGGACSASMCQPTVLIMGQYNALGLAIDAKNLYWTTGGGNVMKAPIVGGSPVTLYSGRAAEGIAVDAAYVYWSTYTEGQLMKIPIDGGQATTILNTTARPLGVAVDANNIYFTSFYVGNVMMLPLTGGTPVSIGSTPSNFGVGIAVNASDIFWGAYDTLLEVPTKDGMTTTLASGQSDVFGVALDGDDVYWTQLYGGAVSKLSLTQGTITSVVTGYSTYAGGIAVDAQSIYWTASDPLNGSTIVRLAK